MSNLCLGLRFVKILITLLGNKSVLSHACTFTGEGVRDVTKSNRMILHCSFVKADFVQNTFVLLLYCLALGKLRL